MTKTFIGAAVALLLPLASHAQISHGGQPLNWASKAAIKIPAQKLPALSTAEFNAVANSTYQVGQAFRYGTQRFISVDVLSKGKWKTLPDGRKVCRLAVNSPDAAMISLQFSEFDMEPGAQLFLYNAKRTSYLGAFTEANELPNGKWATAVVPGETVVLEYIAPVSSGKVNRSLKIESLTHGVLDVFDYGEGGIAKDYWPGYPSANCHTNVVCPIANGWEQAASSVAMFLRPDGDGCTGTMLNNVANDGTPYFYLANHCYVPTESQWVFYFNYDSPTCNGDTGQTVQTMVGATYRASNYNDDFALVELFTQVPSSYNVYLSGWDRSNATPQSSAGIYHPLYDVKKIAVDNHPAASGQGGFGTGTWTTGFEFGGIEAVGSGSPLFDQNKRVVGCTTSAWNGCNNGAGSLVSKFADQWDGPNASNRLRDWLDPSNTTQAMNGYGGGGNPPPPPTGLEVPIRVFLEGPFDSVTGQMKDDLRAAGLIPTTEPYTALGYQHSNNGGGETTSATMLSNLGANAPIDWVFVEVRDAANWSVIHGTRAGLLLASGDIVEPNSLSPLSFDIPAGNYFVGVRHRNHLGVLSGLPIALSNGMPTIDFTNGTAPIYGGLAAVNVHAGYRTLVSGDVVNDKSLIYIGPNNDRDAILFAVGGSVPTNTVAAYMTEDVNLDGVVKYAGANNDRDAILLNIGGSVPTAVRTAYYP